MGIYQDLGSTSYAEPSGGWFTIDSNLVSYSNWKPGEPNNLLGTEHYSEIVIDSATQVEFWNDITDNQANKYGVIEVPASTSPSWSYLWSTGDTTSTINVNPSVDTQYWVAISDGNNTWYDTVDVTVNLLDINITQTDTILCAGDSSGTLGVAINPGYGPYSYLWNTGDVSDSLKNVSVGTYSVVVTDAMGCTADDAITIIQPNNMVVTTQSITNFNGYDVSCNGVNDAAAFVSAAGGTPGYSYSWSNGGATDTLTSLAAGTYFVTVIDSNGCSSQDTLTITEPSALSLSISTLTNVFGNQIDCYGDSSGVLFSAVAGGVGTYSYSWNTGASQDSIYNLGAGTYWVTAQDANGCTITDSITLTQPSLPFSTVASNLSNYNGFGISCNGANDGSISVLAQGSNAPYSYAWSNGATTASQSNLGQGTYSVVVTDSLGCVSNASVVITEPSILTYSYIISDVTCYLGQNGSIEIIPQGGVMPYNIQWFDGTDSTVLDSLGSGYYAFTISDQNNCLVLDSVEIYEPAEIEITVDTIQPTCERINDGQIDAFIYGGTYPYSYTLNGSPVNLPLDSVAVGSYILSVVDSNSCTQTIAFDLKPLQPSCFMIPNMYSPNYDGYNDEFRIRHSSWSSYTLTIYNSIGQLVYSGSSSTPYWDGITNGSPMPTGDYYYQLITNEGEVIYGYVTLIR
jgi:gliding motility-associated-like protein